MTQLDSILNVVIPWGILIMFISIFYVKFKPFCDQIGMWVINIFSKLKESGSNSSSEVETYVYKYGG